MARPIKIKINVTRILKEHLFAGNNGNYLDLVAWPNKNGPDKHGNTHMVCQELNRAARDAGERGPILGNLLLPENETPAPAAKPQQRPPARQQAQEDYCTRPINDGMETDDIPF